jgi:hypothetical protein
MTDLIRALIQIKTPLSLFAFVSLIFLMALRTRRVPELFFELAKEKTDQGTIVGTRDYYSNSANTVYRISIE